jgi:YD repeat-containing protein
VDRRQLLFGMAAVSLGGRTLTICLVAQTTEVAKQLPLPVNSHISDREQTGLRGPVRTVSEGKTRTEYDAAGRLISNRWLASPDSESIETRTYDDSGRLLTDTVRDGNGVITERVYFYDDNGRLLRIVERNGNRTSFRYDEQGHKLEVRGVAHKSDDVERAAVAVGIDLMFADVEGNSEFGLDRTRDASRIKTIYDEHDRPIETQAFDADGRLLSRTTRTYDEQHRITDVRVIIDDPTSLFSAKQRDEMVAQSNVPLDELEAQLKKAFGTMMGQRGKSYTYDSQGRRTKIILYQGALGQVSRTYSYNDHGDVVEERTIFTQDSRIPVGVPFQVDETGNLVPEKPPSEWPPQPKLWEPSVVHYTYQYDHFSNWTEQTVIRSEGSGYTRHRELTYY